MDQRIYVLGKPNFLNQVLVDLIRKEIASACTATESIEPLLNDAELFEKQQPLLLINDDDHDLVGEIERLQIRAVLALFNVNENRDVCREIAHGAVRGVFFVQDKVEHVVRGIRELLRGEIWIPRKVLIDAVLNRKSRETEQEQARLTRREMEILMAVSTGATNDEVAQRMYLSAHTVKTHLYNIYKKIGVTNRLHAARWAMTHSATFPIRVPTGAALRIHQSAAPVT